MLKSYNMRMHRAITARLWQIRAPKMTVPTIFRWENGLFGGTCQNGRTADACLSGDRSGSEKIRHKPQATKGLRRGAAILAHALR